MTQIQKDEIDHIIHLMRQSKMDKVREYLASRVRLRDGKLKHQDSKFFLEQIRSMFGECSGIEPLLSNVP